MSSCKVLLFANTDWYLYNFRLSLAKRLRSEGHEVVFVSPPGEYGPRLIALGFRWISVDFSTGGTNPLAEMLLLASIGKLYRTEKPDLCHHFTIKCVLYGSIAARFAGAHAVVNAVTGMGHVFTDSGLKARLLRPLVRGLYRFALGRRSSRVIFQNDEDRSYFITNKLVRQENTTLIRGSGVDCQTYRPRPDSEILKLNTEPVRILFASRLLREKGVYELAEAFKFVRAKHPRCALLIAGDLYPENPSSLTDRDVADLKTIEGVTFLGHIDNMLPLLAECDIVVLPSYREGTPRILIEAAAMAKSIVATDIAGCRGLVIDGENGFLVPVKSVEPLAKALTNLVDDPGLRECFGRKGREIVLAEFDEEIVIDGTLRVYKAAIRKDERGHSESAGTF